MSPEGRVCYTYTANASKHRSGDVCQLDVPHKVVHQFAHPELSDHCHVFLLDKYFSKIPKSAKKKDVFYLRLLNQAPERADEPWFSCVPVGKNQLSENGEGDVLTGTGIR